MPASPVLRILTRILGTRAAMAFLIATAWPPAVSADDTGDVGLVFDDQPLEEPLTYPSWFEVSLPVAPIAPSAFAVPS